MISSKKAALQDREVFTVAPYKDGWAVEHNGEFTAAATSKEEARAAAHRAARASHDAGKPCQVTVRGESGYFGAGVR